MNELDLTRGTPATLGWTVDAAGNWTPSVYDRRRLVVNATQGMAEASGVDPYDRKTMTMILGMWMRFFATDNDDMMDLCENYYQWRQRLR